MQSDIVFSLSIISIYCNNFNSIHLTALAKILHDIKRKLDESISFYNAHNGLDLTKYSDTNCNSVKTN